MITRDEAARRLRHRWLYQAALQPDLEPFFPLSHFLTPQNVEAVRKLDLYRWYAEPRHHLIPPKDEADRGRALLAAWLHASKGALQ